MCAGTEVRVLRNHRHRIDADFGEVENRHVVGNGNEVPDLQFPGAKYVDPLLQVNAFANSRAHEAKEWNSQSVSLER